MENTIDVDALVVLSGGQDSVTCLYWAKQAFKAVHAVTFDYGQRHVREIEAARKTAEMCGVASHEVVTLGADILKGTSPLTDKTKALETYESAEQMAGIIGNRVELTFVPMRNALFLTLAANRAVCMGIDHLVTGVCQEDNANYPDCRRSFVNAQEYVTAQALGRDHFLIHTPLMFSSKADTVRMAMQIPGCMDALAYSHTAYSGEYPPRTQDHATVLRAQGFLEAGVPDPLIVRAWNEGLMFDLPETSNYDQIRKTEA